MRKENRRVLNAVSNSIRAAVFSMVNDVDCHEDLGEKLTGQRIMLGIDLFSEYLKGYSIRKSELAGDHF